VSSIADEEARRVAKSGLYEHPAKLQNQGLRDAVSPHGEQKGFFHCSIEPRDGRYLPHSK